MIKKFVIKAILVILVFCSLPIILYKYNSIKDIPRGNLIEESVSPDKNYKLRTYLCQGDATTDFAIRGEIVNKLGFKKNIYWSYHEREVKIEWLNNNSVKINDKILEVPKEVYDWREN